MTDTERLITRARYMTKLHPGFVWAQTMEALCDLLVVALEELKVRGEPA